jgi:hypothetical protein
MRDSKERNSIGGKERRTNERLEGKRIRGIRVGGGRDRRDRRICTQ